MTGSLLREEFSLFFGLLFHSFARLRYGLVRKAFFRQVYYTGVQSLLPVCLIASVLGGISLVQLLDRLPGGSLELLSGILALIVVRELAPLLIAFIVIGRSATAIATRIGEMRVSGQFELLVSSGVNPNLYLFVPRIWGLVVSSLALLVFFYVSTLLGCLFAVRAFTYVNAMHLMRGVLSEVSMADLGIAYLKMFFQSYSVALVAIVQALRVRRSPQEVPRAATGAVVRSIVLIILVDVVFAAIFYS